MTGVVTGLQSWSKPDYDSDPHSTFDGSGAVQIASRMVEWQTFGPAIALLPWLLIPGSLQTVDLNVFIVGATIAPVVLFVIGLVVAKLVLDYLQADDDQKI